MTGDNITGTQKHFSGGKKLFLSDLFITKSMLNAELSTVHFIWLMGDHFLHSSYLTNNPCKMEHCEEIFDFK